MRVALGQFSEISNEMLTFARQIGVRGVLLNTPVIPGEAFWEVADLIWLRARVEQYGLHLEAIENTPMTFYEKAILGLPGRDEQIENYIRTIRNLGRAGIPVLGYHWMATDVWRTSFNTAGRGGAQVAAFDLSLLDQNALPAGMGQQSLSRDRAYSAEEVWANYRYFMSAVLPVAEQAGVRLALHPDDPPLPTMGGVARLFYHLDGFKRAMETFASAYHGLDFCVGSWSAMGPGVIDALRYFGERQQVFYVHFRDVKGHAPAFTECFLGEGNIDPVELVKVLHAVRFSGFIIDDHVPHLIDDSDWSHRGHAQATGYISGLVEAVQQLC